MKAVSRVVGNSVALATCALLLSVATDAHAVLSGPPGGPPSKPVLHGDYHVAYDLYYRGLPYAAGNFNKCSSRLSTAHLEALMLPITWHEPESTHSDTPSPETLSRADKNYPALYFQSAPYQQYTRDFWNPGDGIWQFDDVAKPGNKMGLQKFDAQFSAVAAAREISARYCQNSNLSNVYGPWFGCGQKDGRAECIADFNAIYDSTHDKLQDIYTDTSVSDTGGATYDTCRFQNHSTSFACLYVNPNRAQGDTGWRYTPNGSGNYTVAPTPYSRPFYEFTQRTKSGKYEWRVWPKGRRNSAYTTDVGARRAYGTNSRSGLHWTTAPNICRVTPPSTC